MKKIMMLALATVLSCSTLLAQDNAHTKEKKTPAEKAKMSVQRLDKHLNLTPEQEAKIEAINLEMYTKMEEFKGADTKGKKENNERKTVKTDSQQKLKAVLTTEQWAKYQELRKGKQGKMHKKGHDKGKHNKQHKNHQD